MKDLEKKEVPEYFALQDWYLLNKRKRAEALSDIYTEQLSKPFEVEHSSP